MIDQVVFSSIHIFPYPRLRQIVSSSISLAAAREFDTLKSKKVPQSLEIGLFFCQIFIFII